MSRESNGDAKMTTASLAEMLDAMPNVEVYECHIKLSTGVCISFEPPKKKGATDGSK